MNINPPRLQNFMTDLPAELKRPLGLALAAQDKHAQDLATSLRNALVRGDTLQVYWPFTQSSPLSIATDVQTASLLNSWVAVDGTPQYRKDSTGTVWVSGHVSGAPLATATVLTLPVGYRPSQLVIDAAGSTTKAVASVQIDTSGNLNFPFGGNITDIAFNVSFPTSDRQPFVPAAFPFDVGPWPFVGAPPTLVLAQAFEATNQATPQNTSISIPDWIVAVTGGSQMIRIRNIPGLLPSTKYSINVVAF